MPALALRSLWSATASPGPDCSALSTPRRAQAVVIGAGYTGLSAALHLAQAGRDVVVLESTQIGAGAAGVNGGPVIPGVKHDPDTLEAMFGPVVGARLIDTVAAGPAVLFELIERLGISVTVVEGSARNIKITTAEDLAVAEVLVRTIS